MLIKFGSGVWAVKELHLLHKKVNHDCIRNLCAQESLMFCVMSSVSIYSGTPV